MAPKLKNERAGQLRIKIGKKNRVPRKSSENLNKIGKQTVHLEIELEQIFSVRKLEIDSQFLVTNQLST